MKLIESKTLGTAAASIEFTSIPSTFTDLVILFSCRSSDTGFPVANIEVSINGTSTNESRRLLRGSGSTVESLADTQVNFGHMPTAANTSNTFNSTSVYIPNYTAAVAKSMSVDNSSASGGASLYDFYNEISAQLWNDTAAITSILIKPNAGNLVAGSMFSLYGVLKGTDGIVTTS
jgi:hypothetical protein